MEPIVCRRLSLRDLEHYREFLIHRKAHHLDEDERVRADRDRIEFVEKGQTAFASFLNDRIECVLSIHRWEKLPYFTISSLNTTRRTSSRVMTKCIFALYQEVILEMLLEGRTGFLYTMKESHFSIADKESHEGSSWLQKHVGILKLFLFSFEYFIEAGAEIPYEAVKQMLGGQSQDKNFVLRKASLKPKFFFQVHDIVKSNFDDGVKKRLILELTENPNQGT